MTREGTVIVPSLVLNGIELSNKEIESLVEEIIGKLGFDDLFLVDTKVAGNKIEVFLDSDDAVTFEKCRKVSRALEAIFDEDGRYGEKYALDVSSAGIGTPLKLIRQYKKNIGRSILINTEDGESIKGKLESVSDSLVNVSVEEKQGKKKVEVSKEIEIVNIKTARIEIKF